MNRIFVIAEVGVNWLGDYEKLEAMIQGSKLAGADAVKLQAFREEHVTQMPELIKSTVGPSSVYRVEDFARKAEIEWFATPFYPEAVDLLDPFVRRYKIRELDSRELWDSTRQEPSPLLDKVLATNKEVLISTKSRPITPLFLYYHPQIKWLYCVPKYPPDIGDIDFQMCKSHDGYSNHFPHFIAPLTAALMGAMIIEVHVTLDKQLPVPDQAVSFDFDELRQLVELLRIVELMRV